MKSLSHQKGLTWLEIIALFVILFVLVGIVLPPNYYRAAKAGARTEALNNAKGIAGALNAFKADKGAFPCAFTRKILEEEGITHLSKGTDANAYLAQLVATEFIDNEEVFYAAKTFSHKGNNFNETPGTLLEPDENGFAYIMAQNEEPLTDVRAQTPLVLAPIRTGGKTPTFHPEPYKGKGVYGAVDGSGKVFQIDKNGHASTKGRKNLFASGPDSLFGDDIPDIKLPTGLKSPPRETSNWWFALPLIPIAAGLWWLISGVKKAVQEAEPEA